MTGFNGTATITADAGAGTDSVTLNGQAAQVIQVFADPLTTDQNSPASFDFRVRSSLAGSYTLLAAAPAGWTVAFDANGRATVTPAPGTSPGTYAIRLGAASQDNPDLIASGEVLVTVTAVPAGVTLSIDPDPLYYVSVNGAQVPTAFQATVHNTGPATETFAIAPDTVPAGFEFASSLPAVTLAPGQSGVVGIYLQPTGPIAAPGTAATFSLHVTGLNVPTTTASASATFTIPEVKGLTLTDTPSTLSTTPGASVITTLSLTASGNVPEDVQFTVDLPSGLTLAGLAPVSLANGATTTLVVTLTPAAGTPLNTTRTATITASFGAGEPVTLSIPVRVAVPGADAIADAAVAASGLGNAALANRLDDLSIALTSLVQDPTSVVFKSQALASLDSILSLLAADPVLSVFVADLTAAKDALAAATTPAAIQAAVTGLGGALDDFGAAATALTAGNFEIALLPNSQVAQPQVRRRSSRCSSTTSAPTRRPTT